MKINYFKTIALGCMLAGAFSASAQYNEVLRASQFGGVSNVNYNPAIADNRMKFDMNLISAGFSFENNYVGLNPKAITNQDLFNDKDFQSKYLTERLNGKTKQVFLGAQVQGPLSFMFGWGKNRSNKNAIALTWNTNFITNISGVSETLARSAFWGLGTKADSITNFIGKGLNEKNLAVRSLAWMDVGATYSRVVYDKGPHMIKAGVTGKFLVGVFGAYISSSNVDYKFQDNKHLDIKNSDFSYGHSEIISDVYKSGSGSGVDYDAVKKHLANLLLLLTWVLFTNGDLRKINTNMKWIAKSGTEEIKINTLSLLDFR